jgi:hypothetical protein
MRFEGHAAERRFVFLIEVRICFPYHIQVQLPQPCRLLRHQQRSLDILQPNLAPSETRCDFSLHRGMAENSEA